MNQQNEPATKQDLQKVEQKLTTKIEINAAKIDAVDQRLTNKINAVDQRLTGVEQRLAAKIDANTAKIEENGRKIDANTAKIEENGRKIDANTAKIEENGRKIDANHTALVRISSQVVENSEQIKQLIAANKEFREYFHKIISDLDGLAMRFAHLDQERVAINNRIDRVEADVTVNKKEIKKIKTKLAMP